MLSPSINTTKTLVKGESKVLEFRYFNRDGSKKDVSGDAFTLKIADEDNNEIWLKKSDADFDTTDDTEGKIRAQITPTRSGFFIAELQRDEGGATGELDRFRFRLIVDKTLYDI